MTAITIYQREREFIPSSRISETPAKTSTALYHCEVCDAWWGKDSDPSNPLKRFALFLAHSFDWRHYHGWQTGEGMDHTCVICGHANPTMFIV